MMMMDVHECVLFRARYHPVERWIVPSLETLTSLAAVSLDDLENQKVKQKAYARSCVCVCEVMNE